MFIEENITTAPGNPVHEDSQARPNTTLCLVSFPATCPHFMPVELIENGNVCKNNCHKGIVTQNTGITWTQESCKNLCYLSVSADHGSNFTEALPF